MTPCPSELTLSRYHDGELEPTEKSTIREHLSQCEPCRSHIQALQQLDERILMSLSRAKSLSLAAQRRPFRKLLVAAVLLLVAGGLTLAGLGGHVAKPPAAPTKIWREEYAFVSASGATYQVKTRGEVQMLSLEVAGAVTHLDKKERR